MDHYHATADASLVTNLWQSWWQWASIGEESFKSVKHSLTIGSPVPCCVLFKELLQWFCHGGILREELDVIGHHAYKLPWAYSEWHAQLTGMGRCLLTQHENPQNLLLRLRKLTSFYSVSDCAVPGQQTIALGFTHGWYDPAHE